MKRGGSDGGNGIIWFIMSWIVVQYAVPQTDTTFNWIKKDVLQAEDLVFPIDSERL